MKSIFKSNRSIGLVTTNCDLLTSVKNIHTHFLDFQK